MSKRRSPKKKPTAEERYEELMRNAGEKMRALNRAALERERAFRKAEAEFNRKNKRLDEKRKMAVLQRIRAEVALIDAKLRDETDREERVGLRAELAHLRKLMGQVADRRWGFRGRRKPPESGTSVPAVPPKGPQPKQGGAAAPLDFGVD